MKRFELLREYYGLTQQEVADAIGVTKQFISKFEKGEKKSARIENFYTHKNFRRLFFNKNNCSIWEPIVDYVQFVLDSTSPVELNDEKGELIRR